MTTDAGTADIPIAVTVRVTGDRISFDFTGTAAQTDGNINAPLNASHCDGLLHPQGARRSRRAEQPGRARRLRSDRHARGRW